MPGWSGDPQRPFAPTRRSSSRSRSARVKRQARGPRSAHSGAGSRAGGSRPRRDRRGRWGSGPCASPLAPVDRCLTAMGAAVMHDPEHSRGRGVGLACHHLLDQATKRRDAGGGLAAGLDRGLRRPRRRTRLAPAARPQPSAGTSRARPLPWRRSPGHGKDPRPVPPRLEGVLIPAPHGADTDLLHQPTGDGLLAHVSDAEAAQRDRPQRGQLTGDRLDLRDDHRGGKGPRPASVEVTRRTYETRHQIDRVAG